MESVREVRTRERGKGLDHCPIVLLGHGLQDKQGRFVKEYGDQYKAKARDRDEPEEVVEEC